MNKTIKMPGPDHPITITPTRGQVVCHSCWKSCCAHRAAQTLKEAFYPPVQYIPRADVEMSLLAHTDHATYCPYKGDCSYYSIPSGGDRSANAAWTYEDAYPAVAAIKGYLAFYSDRVDGIEVQP